MDYQGQSLNPNLDPNGAPKTPNAAPVNGAENPYLPPTRDMGELGGRLVSSDADSLTGESNFAPEAPSLEEVMNSDNDEIKVEELEKPPLMPDEMPVVSERNNVAETAAPADGMIKGNTISPEGVKRVKALENIFGKDPARATDEFAVVSDDFLKDLRGYSVGDDPAKDRAA
ncbi:hypothetical protein IKH83_02230 [Candidatus Saccharibacteria bacterium]|nr:hypothetical protein [Candidatus Saccharibacteria bacterium]